jgi:hypothetical protein
MEAQLHAFETALSIKNYDEQDCLSAIRGKKVPSALGYTVTRLCVIRGIRYLSSQLRYRAAWKLRGVHASAQRSQVL